jgi:hypothetical protein
MPLPAFKCFLMASSTFAGTLGPPELLALLPHAMQAGIGRCHDEDRRSITGPRVGW